MPKSTRFYQRASDHTVYNVFSDGSVRRFPPRIRGKARVKAAKRVRQQVRGTR